jgi:flagellar hook-length control protein FliK
MAATGLSVSIPSGAAPGAAASAPADAPAPADSAHSFSCALSRATGSPLQAAAADDVAPPADSTGATPADAHASDRKTTVDASSASPSADAAALALILPLLPVAAATPSPPVAACTPAPTAAPSDALTSALTAALAPPAATALGAAPPCTLAPGLAAAPAAKTDKTPGLAARDAPALIALTGTADLAKAVSDAALDKAARDVQAALAHGATTDLGQGVTSMLQGDPRSAFVVPQFASAEAAAAHHAPPSPAHELHGRPALQTPVGSFGWADGLGAQLTTMARHGVQSASLSLTPEHLGPLEIKIEVHSDHASVWFGAAHPETRLAVEQALPRLRELFAAQGLSLTDAGVSREAPRDPARSAPRVADANPDAAGVEAVAAPRSARLGLLDTYA